MVECTFGILASQWRLYRRVLGLSPEVADHAVKATCILHNFPHWDWACEVARIQTTDLPDAVQLPVALQPVERTGSNNASREALAVRETFTTYFSSAAGWVPRQESET